MCPQRSRRLCCCGLIGKEGAVIRKTLLPFFYYALMTGSIGYGIVNLNQGLLNPDLRLQR